MGVTAAALATAALRPPPLAASGWRRTIAAIDRLAEPGAGGICAAATAVLLTAAAFPVIFTIAWRGAGVSAPTAAALMSIGIGLGASWPLLRRAWRGVEGPHWPAPPAWTWLILPVAGVGGWGVGRLLEMFGATGLETAGALMGALSWCGFAAGAAWRSVGVANG